MGAQVAAEVLGEPRHELVERSRAVEDVAGLGALQAVVEGAEPAQPVPQRRRSGEWTEDRQAPAARFAPQVLGERGDQHRAGVVFGADHVGHQQVRVPGHAPDGEPGPQDVVGPRLERTDGPHGVAVVQREAAQAVGRVHEQLGIGTLRFASLKGGALRHGVAETVPVGLELRERLAPAVLDDAPAVRQGSRRAVSLQRSRQAHTRHAEARQADGQKSEEVQRPGKAKAASELEASLPGLAGREEGARLAGAVLVDDRLELASLARTAEKLRIGPPDAAHDRDRGVGPGGGVGVGQARPRVAMLPGGLARHVAGQTVPGEPRETLDVFVGRKVFGKAQRRRGLFAAHDHRAGVDAPVAQIGVVEVTDVQVEPWRTGRQAGDRRRGDRRAQHLGPGALVATPRRDALVLPLARPVDAAEVTEQVEDVGELLHDGALPGELARRPFVVGVEKGDQVAGRGSHTRVARRPGAEVRRAQVAQRRVEVAHDGLGVVARAVVDDDDLVAGPALGERRAQRALEQARAVVRRYDRRDAQVWHVTPLETCWTVSPAGKDNGARAPVSGSILSPANARHASLTSSRE